MLSFYQKLASKLNETAAGAPQDAAPSGAAGKRVSFKATGERVEAAQAPAADAKAPADAAVDQVPEGADPLDVDLFQSDARMAIFAQMPGVAKDDFEITIDEESNTVTIQASQKRTPLPPMPPVSGVAQGEAPAEKGRYLKQETKWRNLYRKVYLPASFDGSEAGAFLDRGVLVVILPSKHPGAGKKLAVKELPDEKRENQPEK
jgi:HSP20 family molecular chaperone IbpA